MPRPKNLTETEKLTVYLPLDIIAWLDTCAIDPASGKVIYGERARIIEAALRQYRKEKV